MKMHRAISGTFVRITVFEFNKLSECRSFSPEDVVLNNIVIIISLCKEYSIVLANFAKNALCNVLM